MSTYRCETCGWVGPGGRTDGAQIHERGKGVMMHDVLGHAGNGYRPGLCGPCVPVDDEAREPIDCPPMNENPERWKRHTCPSCKATFDEYRHGRCPECGEMLPFARSSEQATADIASPDFAAQREADIEAWAFQNHLTPDGARAILVQWGADELIRTRERAAVEAVLRLNWSDVATGLGEVHDLLATLDAEATT